MKKFIFAPLVLALTACGTEVVGVGAGQLNTSSTILPSSKTESSYTVNISGDNADQLQVMFETYSEDVKDVVYDQLSFQGTNYETATRATKTYDCPQGGNFVITYFLDASGDEETAQARTNSCFVTTGEFVYNFDRDYVNDTLSGNYRFKSADGVTYTAEFAQQGELTEVFITSSALGSLLLRIDSDEERLYAFGANGTYADVTSEPNRANSNRPCLLEDIIIFNINGNVYEEVSESTSTCTSNNAQSGFNNWQDQGSTLVYKLTVNSDTNVWGIFTPASQKVEMLGEWSSGLEGFREYMFTDIGQVHYINQYFYAGEYYFYFKNYNLDGASRQFYYEFDSADYSFELVDEILPPALLGQRLGNWNNSGGTDVNHVNNPVYDLQITTETRVYISLTSNIDTYLYLTDASLNVLELNDDYGSGTNSYIEKTLSPGNYKIVAATYADGVSGAYDLTVRADSASAGSLR